MPFSYRIFLSVFLTMLNIHCFGQQIKQTENARNSLELFETHLKNSLISWYSKYPQEKVFLHANQEYYSSGETIWYKAYVMAYGKPTAISKILYVQLTDTSGNVIIQNMLPLLEGKANGEMDINHRIKTGWYRLSAFTSWMMNFGQQAYYQQRIYINNLSDSTSAHNLKENIKKTYHITFYPEGGDLINGELSKIAFHALDENGLPATVDGIIKDNTNKTSVKLITLHNGMGEFIIDASSADSYTATVRFPDGSQQNIKLPEVKSTGICLQASQSADNIHLKVAYSGPKEKFENCILAAIENSGQIITCPLRLSSGINEFDLRKSSFSTGILRLTIFDGAGVPQTERILFINKHDLQFTRLRTDTLSFLPRNLNSFSTVIRDNAGNPVSGNFSVSVTDGDAFNDKNSQNIFSALLLSPELRGEIYNPAYYFTNESDSLAQQLDLVMLTNGWRHFSWQKILNNESDQIQYPVEQSAYIAGRVIDNGTLQINKYKFKIMIINQDSSRFMGYITPDSAGRFIIKDFDHTGISDIYLQATDKKGHVKKMPIKILKTLNDSLQQVKSYSFDGRAIPNLSKYYLSSAKKQEQNLIPADGIMLKTVNVKDRKITPTEKLIAQHVSPNYHSYREFTLDLINKPTLDIGFIDYIRGKFQNLQVLGDNVHPVFIYRGGNTLQSSSSSPQSSSNGDMPFFYVNEKLVNYPFVADIPMEDIAMIRFMPPPVPFAPYNGGNIGAIMVYTKINSDDIKKITPPNDFDHYVFNGFSITREFGAPDYSKENLEKTATNDNRLTLFWNHDLNTDSNGVLKFRFYNSDSAKKFRVIIQGMDRQGRLVYLQQVVQQNP